MASIQLIAAGLLEIVWATAMKHSAGFTRPIPTSITVLAMIASFILLAAAMKSLPLGTSYVIWTGIGAVGAFVARVVLFDEAVTPLRLVGAVLIVAGLAIMKLSSGQTG